MGQFPLVSSMLQKNRQRHDMPGIRGKIDHFVWLYSGQNSKKFSNLHPNDFLFSLLRIWYVAADLFKCIIRFMKIRLDIYSYSDLCYKIPLFLYIY